MNGIKKKLFPFCQNVTLEQADMFLGGGEDITFIFLNGKSNSTKYKTLIFSLSRKNDDYAKFN